jgi:hypothetical protein
MTVSSFEKGTGPLSPAILRSRVGVALFFFLPVIARADPSCPLVHEREEDPASLAET